MDGGGRPAHYVNIHKDRSLVILGTGPSVWDFGSKPEVRALLRKTINIGVNRGFHTGNPVTYQISLDRIWDAFLRQPAPQACFQRLRQTFERWKKKHKTGVKGWLMEDWLFAYQDELDIHPEVWRYFMLCSVHTPFSRWVVAHNMKAAPYPCVPFGRAKQRAAKGVYPQGLVVHGNTAHTAIHLAAIFGAKRIYLLGVDMTVPDKKARAWETTKVYYKKRVKQGFALIVNSLRGKVQIVNLNPKALLGEVPRVQDETHAIRLLEDAASES